MNSLFARWERTYQAAPKDLPLLVSDPTDPNALRYSYRELYATVHCLSAYLLSKKIARGERVLVLADCHPLTVALDLALQAVGVVNVALSPNSPLNHWLEAVRLTSPKMIFCSSLPQYRTLHAILAEEHKDIPIVVRTAPRDELNLDDRFTIFERVVDMGKVYWREHQDELRQAKEAVQPDDLSTVVFYQECREGEQHHSPLLNAALTHRNLLTSIEGLQERLNATITADNTRFLCATSPADIMARTAGIYYPLIMAKPLQLGRSLRRVLPLMQSTAPTHLVCPARGLAMLQQLLIRTRKNPAKQAERFAKALALCAERLGRQQRGEKIPLTMRWRYNRVRKGLWIPLRKKVWTSVQYLLTESQALTSETELFFTTFDLCLAAGCCRPETAGFCTLNDPAKPTYQSAGAPLTGVQLRVGSSAAEHGPISLRGPQVSTGPYSPAASNASANGDFRPLPLRGHLHDGRLYLAEDTQPLVYRAR